LTDVFGTKLKILLTMGQLNINKSGHFKDMKNQTKWFHFLGHLAVF